MRRRAREEHVYLLFCGWIPLPRKDHAPILYTKPNYPSSFRWTREVALEMERRQNG